MAEDDWHKDLAAACVADCVLTAEPGLGEARLMELVSPFEVARAFCPARRRALWDHYGALVPGRAPAGHRVGQSELVVAVRSSKASAEAAAVSSYTYTKMDRALCHWLKPLVGWSSSRCHWARVLWLQRRNAMVDAFSYQHSAGSRPVS